MHLAQAVVLFCGVFGIVGVPADTQLAHELGAEPIDESTGLGGNVVEGSAAAAAGREPGDDLVSIAGEPVVRFEDVGPLVEERGGDEVALVVERDGRTIEVDTTIGRRPDDRSLGFLGIGGGFPEQPNVRAGFVRTFTEAGSTTATFLGETVTSLGSFFTGGIGDFASTVIEGGNTEPSGPTVGSGGSGGAASSASVDDSGPNRLVLIRGVARIEIGRAQV